MKENKEQPGRKGIKKGILNEDEGKRTPPGPAASKTGEAHRGTHPELGPNIPPHERTEGIP